MKKIVSVFAVCATLVMFSSAALAYDELATNELKLGSAGGGAGADPLIIGLSPKVTALYHSAGTTVATAQWYAVASVHPGGTKIFATASDLNNIIYKAYVKGTTIDVALFALPANAVSATDWSENGGYSFE